ncbi:hypothetical protein EYF80_049331 [Liparis tanakae]|uniref:Uncharacterized protein n=1 Tax=Liparis tanakae TaxID=230148 RepID=A0A4Z2FIA3_9TELE|nr:hypothetical protein EYF80_049331 [Liparis tanakae]
MPLDPLLGYLLRVKEAQQGGLQLAPTQPHQLEGPSGEISAGPGLLLLLTPELDMWSRMMSLIFIWARQFTTLGQVGACERRRNRGDVAL